MLDEATAKNVIVTSVGCANPDLMAFLQSNMDSLWCSVTEKCASELRFYRVQLSAIEAALAFVRHRIDETHSSSLSTSSSESSSEGYSDSQGQGTNQGTSCGYTTAVTLSQSRSDSRSQNQSATDALSHGESQSQSHSWDRGNGTSDSYSQSYANTVGGGWGDSFNYNVTHIVIHVEAHSREDGPGPMMSLTPGFPVFQITPPFFTDPQLGDEYNDPGYDKPPYPGFRCGAVESTQPNYSQWYDGSYNVEISTPIFDAGATWDVGADFDQVHIVTTACDESSTNFITEGTSTARSSSNSVGNGITHSESYNQQDAHGISSNSADSRSDTYTASNSLSQGDSESYSETDSEGRAEAQSSSQSTSWGKRHSESMAHSESHSESQSESVMWSQIFNNLNELWKRTLTEIKKRDKQKVRGAFKMSHSRLATVRFTPLRNCGPMPRQFTPLH